MKISKSQLRQIIKEEASSLRENKKERFGVMGNIDHEMERIWDVINQYPDEQDYLTTVFLKIEEFREKLESQFDMAPQSDVDYQMDLDQAAMDAGHWQEEV